MLFCKRGVETEKLPNLSKYLGRVVYDSQCLDAFDSWVSQGTVRKGNFGFVRYVHAVDCIFGCVEVPLTVGAECLETESVYRDILLLLSEAGDYHLIRVWHYLPKLLSTEGRYQRFCDGRYRAFKDMLCEPITPQLPAATLIGHHGDDVMRVYFLAGCKVGRQIENDDQISAFHYPVQYGKVSPSFSRAVLACWGQEKHLYISGTACVVGHRSRFGGDVAGQLSVIYSHLGGLIAQANAHSHLNIDGVGGLSGLVVYVKRQEDMTLVKAIVEQWGKWPLPTIFVHGDICRTELLVEVEAMWLSRINL